MDEAEASHEKIYSFGGAYISSLMVSSTGKSGFRFWRKRDSLMAMLIHASMCRKVKKEVCTLLSACMIIY